MEETNDVQALEKISSEVDESQIKVILSNQCIKAQAFLLDKLKKQAERHKETCGFISSANLKLEAEIKQAEHEINSMLIAHETIKSANIEIRKEWLVAKVRKTEITERTEEGKKRYEALWLQCKTRYENIPFVQNLLRATEKTKALNSDIEGLDNQITKLYEEMNTKREICIDLDRKRCTELANYMVIEMPDLMKIINTKSQGINDVTKQIEDMLKEQETIIDTVVITPVVEPQNSETNEMKINVIVKNNTDDLNKSDDDNLIPKLELGNFDLDIIDVNLERVKMKNDEVTNTFVMTSGVTNDLEKSKMTNIQQKYSEEKSYDYEVISPYFNAYKANDAHNFSKRKLINILEDIHIDNNEAYNIVKKVNRDNLRTVNEIYSDVLVVENVRESQTFLKDKGTPIESDNIEEVDMTRSNADIIIPPTQFLDITLTSSQDDVSKKRVSFEIPPSLKINEIIEDVDKQNDNDEIETANQTINSHLDVSVTSEDSFMNIKEMILKKHNLDLSPQFVYAKNPVLQKKDDDKIVTSKFFQNDNQEIKTDQLADNKMETEKELKDDPVSDIKLKDHETSEGQSVKDKDIPMDVDEMIVSSPKENKRHEEQRSEKPVTGLLFTHGTQAIPDSLNASISTTGFEDSDFPHCIDSSLLLSPKADVPLTGDNADVLSQEVPNFLSGFRKTGLSFFGGGNASSSETKPDSSAQNDGNNFSFNFGGEKKNRGGLFSLF